MQVMYSATRWQDPILAAVGQLQFEVVQARMGAGVRRGDVAGKPSRLRGGGWGGTRDAAGRIFNAQCVKDQWGAPVLLFKNQWNVDQLIADTPEIGALSPISIPPSAE